MAQFSMEIMRLTGSVLRGNQQRSSDGVPDAPAAGLAMHSRVPPAVIALRTAGHPGHNEMDGLPPPGG
jgi:hypothetical protein